jgi:RNA polymerase sigma-70 factor (ECF subfamily)
MKTLMQSIKNGHRGDFLAFYRLTVPRVLELANRLLDCLEDAQEVVDDVYLHAWNYRHRYDPDRGSVRAWLSVLTRHKAIDRYRRRRSSVSLDDEEELQAAFVEMGVVPAADQEVMQMHASRELHRALRLLPPHRRRMLGLAFFRGLSHQEISAQLSMPLGSVKSHIRRALGVLRLNMATTAAKKTQQVGGCG